jgi:hypothetical protein
MAEQLKPTHGVMEGGGSYNRHARIPAAAGRLTLPILDEAVRSLALASDDRPVVIADYGSSQGTNSLIPIRAAVKVLRARAGADRPILVVHVDQVANDFNTLFAVLHSDPDCYSIDDANVFSAAIGRSFYERVLPRRYVHLGWSSYAAVWLSRIPSTIPGHFMVLASDGEVRAQFDRQAAEDWKLFLRARAEELAPGGRLVVVLPGLNDDGKSGFEILFAIANEVLAEMTAQGVITGEERARMVLGAYPRLRSQLLAPFADDGSCCGLTVARYDLSPLLDTAWNEYEVDGNQEMLVTRHARFFRSVFAPSLAAALAEPERRERFADELEQRLARRLGERPTPIESFAQTIVLAKEN